MFYKYIVFVHLLLFVFWLGGDLGVFILGQQSRRTDTYTLAERLTLLKVLVMIDMGPRTCIAIMVPISLTLAHTGGYWIMPSWLLTLGWLSGAILLIVGWVGFLNHEKPIAKRAKKIDFYMQIAMAVFYGGIAIASITTNKPIEQDWLAAKTFLYCLIFMMSIMIDLSYRPIGPALVAMIENDIPETQNAVLVIQNRTRKWVISIYLLLFLIGFVGTVKPF